MLNRLFATILFTILLGMLLGGDITPGSLTSILGEKLLDIPGRVRKLGPLTVEAMIDGRGSPASAENDAELTPSTIETVRIQAALQGWPQPSVSVLQALTKLSGPPEAFGLTHRGGDGEGFVLPGVAADDSLASLMDMTPAPAPFFGLPDQIPWGRMVSQLLSLPRGTGSSDASRESPFLDALSSVFVTLAPIGPETNAPSSGNGNMSEGLSPSNIHLSGGIHVTVTGSFPTPLQEFGIAPTPGVDVRIPEGLEVIATPVGVIALQYVTFSDVSVFAGITPLGPLAGIHVSHGPVTAHVTEVLSAGRVLTAAALTFQTGDVSVAYVVGPGGTSLSGHLFNGPVDFTLSVTSSGPQVSLVCVL